MNFNFKDLTGQTLNGFKVLERSAEIRKNKIVLWICECLTCGAISRKRGDNLRRGKGCKFCFWNSPHRIKASKKNISQQNKRYKKPCAMKGNW